MLQGKKIIVGITGGIAAYKAADLVSRLRKNGAEVWVVMTQNAKKFVSAITFRSLSHNPVISAMFTKGSKKFPHLSLAEKADLLIVAPATANFIGKAANGIADDILSTTFISVRSPILIAPAMNTSMYKNALVKENIKRLKKAKCLFVEPKNGILACGEKGQGKMASVETIFEKALQVLNVKKKKLPLHNKTLLITGGGSKEPIDPVRYISNASSGKMAQALKTAAIKSGAQVHFIDAATDVATFRKKVLKAFAKADGLIMAAAVSDYTLKKKNKKKIKSNSNTLTLELKKTPDILAELGKKKKKNQILVGFCLETEDLISRAQKKLRKKKLDLIIANSADTLGSDESKAAFIFADGSVVQNKKMSKSLLGEKIIEEVCRSFSKQK